MGGPRIRTGLSHWEKWDGRLAVGAGKTSAYWGYSERLHRTAKCLTSAGAPSAVASLRVASLPLGTQATPLLLTDALVRRLRCQADPACDRTTAAFVEFINGTWGTRALHPAKDAKSIGKAAVPRCLLPTTTPTRPTLASRFFDPTTGDRDEPTI